MPSPKPKPQPAPKRGRLGPRGVKSKVSSAWRKSSDHLQPRSALSAWQLAGDPKEDPLSSGDGEAPEMEELSEEVRNELMHENPPQNGISYANLLGACGKPLQKPVQPRKGTQSKGSRQARPASAGARGPGRPSSSGVRSRLDTHLRQSAACAVDHRYKVVAVNRSPAKGSKDQRNLRGGADGQQSANLAVCVSLGLHKRRPAWELGLRYDGIDPFAPPKRPQSAPPQRPVTIVV